MKRVLLQFVALLLILVPLAGAQTIRVTTSSDAARASFEKGRDALGHSQFDKARALLDEAIAADPDFSLAHLYRASISPPEARDAHMEKATARAADVSEGERMMIEAYALRIQNEMDGEMARLVSTSQKYPGDPHSAFIQGWRHYTAERYPEAAAAARQALAADPGYSAAYNLLGYSLLEQEDFSGAEEALKNYVRLAPDEANPYDSLGELYLIMRRYDEAAPQFAMALERDPEFTVSRDNLARVGIEKTNRQFEEAFNRQDAGALANLYTTSALLMPPGSENVSGRDAVREFWAGVFATGADGVVLTTTEVNSMGDAAVELGTATLRVGGEEVDEGRYAVVWRKVGESWMLHRDLWNSSRTPTAPPPPVVTGGE
jgi:ketosteroid isomerase-like protein